MNVTIFKSTDANNSVATFPEGAYHICLQRSNIYNDNIMIVDKKNVNNMSNNNNNKKKKNILCWK